MSAFTPSAHWFWLCRDDFLQLETGQSIHRTGFRVSALINTPQQQALTLEQAEAYWLYWHQLEALGWPAEHCFAAAIDAVAGQFFLRQTGHKSWEFQVQSRHYMPVTGAFVMLRTDQSLLAIVLCQSGECARILLLEHGLSLQGKPLMPGQVHTVLRDRLLPYQQQTPTKLAKSA